MTTFDIESAANRGNIATDMNVGIALRYQIIPEFLNDVKVCAWRKKRSTVTTSAGTQSYALATDFGEMREVQIVGYDPLEYTGEDEEKVFAAQTATTQARPQGYYLGRDPDATVGSFKHLFLDAPPDGVYTIRYTYLYTIPFVDNVSPVDLAAWIPDQYHWGLVEGLRREIYMDRFGVGDARAEKAAADFDAWKARALANTEVAKHGERYISIR